MKRLLSTLLAISLLFSLCACSVVFPSTDTLPSDDEITEPNTPDITNADKNEPDQPSGDENAAPPTDDSQEPPKQDDPIVDPNQGDDTQTPDDTDEPDDTDDPDDSDEPVEYIRTIDPYAPMVALTFDDGPHDIYSMQILDVLEQYNSVATFFEVGYNARLYPEVLVRMVALGCEIASHTNAHHDLTTLSKDAMLTDLAKLDQIIYNATGIMPTLVRPPYGATNSMVRYESGRAMILWTVDTQDWRYRDAQVLIDYFKNYGNLDGEIVLMHSIHRSTAEAMVTVIPWLIEQGYQLVTVSELMAYYYGELLEANHYYNQTYFARHDRTDSPLELPDEPMQTDIPPYNTVPVVPTPKPDDTPSDTGENPSGDSTEQPPETENPTTNPETPPEQSETPSEQPETPTENPETPPDQSETPSENPETPSEDPEVPPVDEEPILPPDEGTLPPEDDTGSENEGESDTVPDDSTQSEDNTSSDDSENNTPQ